MHRLGQGWSRFSLLLLAAAYWVFFQFTLHSPGLPERQASWIFLGVLSWMASRTYRERAPGRFSNFADLLRRKAPRSWLGLGWALLAVFFIYRYWQAGGFGGVFTRYEPFMDQGHYFNMAEKIRTWNVGPRDYNYGLGYPGLAAATSWIWPRDPFLIVDCLCYSGGISLFFLILRQLGLPRGVALLVCLYAALNGYWIAYMLTPWSSSATFVAYAAALWVSLKPDRSSRDYLTFGFAAGILFVARYVDVILVLPIGIALIWTEIQSIGIERTLRKVAGGVLISTVIFGGVLLSHRLILGGYLETPYRWHTHPGEQTTDADLHYYLRRSLASVVFHLQGQLVEARSGDPHYAQALPTKETLFVVNPLMLFAPAGLFLVMQDWRRRGQPRRIAWGIAVGLALFLLIYGLHPGTAPGCKIFGSLHYFKAPSILFLAGGCIYCWRLMTGYTERWRLLALGAGTLLWYALIAGLIYCLPASQLT